MSSSRSIARPARRRSRTAPRLERGAHCRFCAGQADLPGAHRSAARSRAVRGADAAAPPAKELPAAARRRPGPGRRGQGHRHGAARSGQAGPATPATSCPATRSRPAAPCATGAMRRAAIAALISLGLARDDVIAETMRSPKQVEIRAKARGLKVPTEFIVSHPLRRLAGAERERARPGARTGRDRAVIFRGTRSLPGRRQHMTKTKHDHDPDLDH